MGNHPQDNQKHTKDSHPTTKNKNIKKINHKTHHFTLKCDLQKNTSHTPSQTHIQKKKIQSQDTTIPHNTHNHPQDNQKNTQKILIRLQKNKNIKIIKKAHKRFSSDYKKTKTSKKSKK